MAFSKSIVEAAWRRSGGKCECGRSTCGHGYRCSKALNWFERGNDKASGGWEAHHKVAVDSGGGDTLSNCEILCIPCHKNTVPTENNHPLAGRLRLPARFQEEAPCLIRKRLIMTFR